MSDIVICLPARAGITEKGSQISSEPSYVKVNILPVAATIGDRCWFVYEGLLVGYRHISKFLRQAERLLSITSHVESGAFVELSGVFYPSPQILEIPNFRGYRYLKTQLSDTKMAHLLIALHDANQTRATDVTDPNQEPKPNQGNELSDVSASNQHNRSTL